jgi:Zinc carboxypeptidase.
VLALSLVAATATTLQDKEDLYSIPAKSRYSQQSFAGKKPLTRPERTNFTETSHYEDVVAFIDSLKLLGAKIQIGSIGKTALGRSLPYVIASRPLITSPAEARRLGRPVAYIQANIHSGEVEGKEAMLSMLRDLVFDKNKNVLDSIVLIVQPVQRRRQRALRRERAQWIPKRPGDGRHPHHVLRLEPQSRLRQRRCSRDPGLADDPEQVESRSVHGSPHD